VAGGESLAIAIPITASDAASPAIQAAQPAGQAFAQLEQITARSAQAVAQASAQGSRAATDAAREQVRSATDAARELQRITADQSRASVVQAQQAVRTAPGPLTRRAAEEQLAAARDVAREQQRLATDAGRAVTRAAQDAARAQVAEARAAAGQLSNLQQGLGQAAQGVGRGVLSETVGGGLLIAGGLGVAAGVAAITRETIRFGTESVSAFAGYERAIRETNALLGQSGQVSERTFRRMYQDVLNFSTAMGTDAVESARALYQTISAGIPQGAQAMAVLQAAAQASIGGFSSLEVAVDGLTSVLNAYKLTSEDVGRVNDIAFQTVNVGKINYQQLSSVIGQVAPIAAQAGVSFQEIGGFLANATAQGISAGQAVDSLRQIIVNFIRPSDEARKIAQALGLEFNGAALRSQGLAASLNAVYRATGGDQAIITRLFGDVQALNGVLASTGPNADGMARSIDQVTNSAGAAARATEEVNKSTSRNLQTGRAEWERFRIEAGGAVADVAGEVIGYARALGTAADAHRAWVQEMGSGPSAADQRIVSPTGFLTPEQQRVQASIAQRLPAIEATAAHRRQERADEERTRARPTEEDDTRRQNLADRAAQREAQAAERAAAIARQRIADQVNAEHAVEDMARQAQRAQTEAVASEEVAARQRQRGVASLQESADAAARAIQNVQDHLSESQESLNQWLQAPLRGTRELEEALGRVQDRVAGADLTLAQTRYEQIRARIEGAPPPIIDIEALRAAAMTRALGGAESDVLRARRQVEIDPLERSRRLAAQRPEVSGEEAIINVQRLAPDVYRDEAAIRQGTPAVREAQRRAQDAQRRAQAAEQDSRDRLDVIQRDSAQAQAAAQDYAQELGRQQEIAQRGGAPTTGRTPEQQARLDQLTQAATAAAQRAQEASAAFQAGQGQLLLPSTIGTGPAAWQGQRPGGAGSFAPTPLLPPTMTFNFGDFNFPQSGLSADQIKAIAKEQAGTAIDKFVDEGLAQAPGPAAAPTLAGSKR
jgi:TP901 family phage tail tape measure protein